MQISLLLKVATDVSGQLSSIYLLLVGVAVTQTHKKSNARISLQQGALLPVSALPASMQIVTFFDPLPCQKPAHLKYTYVALAFLSSYRYADS